MNGVDSLRQHRSSYPALSERTYLNFGARGVMPRVAREAILNSLDTLQSVGPASRAGIAWIEYELFATRRSLAALIGAPPERIALLDSVSNACSLVIFGIRWAASDHAVVCEFEPPGTWLAIEQASRRFGFEVSGFPAPTGPNDTQWREALLRALRPSTRLVIASHINWITGAHLAPSQLVSVVRASSAPRALILVDGAQAIGVLPFELRSSEVDLYAFGGQKWLGGPDGIAALFVSESAQNAVEPSIVGWRGLNPAPEIDRLSLSSTAVRYEGGTAAYCLLAGLRAAVEAQQSFATLAERFASIEALTARFRRQIAQMNADATRPIQILGEDARSGITTFQIEGTCPSAVYRRLEGAGMVIKQHARPPSVRVCAHYLTLTEEIDQLCGQLRHFTHAGARPGA
ncbi:MAG TPA: aminotransferase class V-fold PLP-dependent enzyme [Steroidobacteraceae bacterium]|jgi:L-cysteine/cystine lyase|nr:aminotransferase class V-fold PLP-dependent enzyme [Steroidobacteraceae bacterium]